MRIWWRRHADEPESLAVALRALRPPLSSEADRRAYARSVALLGLGAGIATPPEEPPEAWPELARDLALVPAAEALGIRLRGLQPWGAERGLGTSAEFPLHFADSYAPLIRRALHVGQVALAWRGWPEEQADSWGIITSATADASAADTGQPGGGFLGYVGSATGAGDAHAAAALTPLTHAAHAVYVVEEVTPREPDLPAATLHRLVREAHARLRPHTRTDDLPPAAAARLRAAQAAERVALAGAAG